MTLHGGPGFPHDYFECFEDFLPQQGIQFFYYDQLGAGSSDTPDDDSLWTVARYRGEVEQVRNGLGLDHFYLYASTAIPGAGCWRSNMPSSIRII